MRNLYNLVAAYKAQLGTYFMKFVYYGFMPLVLYLGTFIKLKKNYNYKYNNK